MQMFLKSVWHKMFMLAVPDTKRKEIFLTDDAMCKE